LVEWEEVTSSISRIDDAWSLSGCADDAPFVLCHFNCAWRMMYLRLCWWLSWTLICSHVDVFCVDVLVGVRVLI
jgi:hypothetical protein